MSRILTGTTVLPDPTTLLPLVLRAGDELPDWADGMVGGHLLGEAGEAPAETEPEQDEPAEGAEGAETEPEVVDEKPAPKPTRRRTTK